MSKKVARVEGEKKYITQGNQQTCVINGEILFVVDLTIARCNGTGETTNNNDDIVFIIITAHERAVPKNKTCLLYQSRPVIIF